MRAGNLRHKITIEKPTYNTNDFGEEENSYQMFQETFASVEQFSIKEAFFSSHIIEVSTKKFRIRYVSGLEMDMRIKFNGKYFDIKEIVNPYERNRELIIAASEIL